MPFWILDRWWQTPEKRQELMLRMQQMQNVTSSPVTNTQVSGPFFPDSSNDFTAEELYDITNLIGKIAFSECCSPMTAHWDRLTGKTVYIALTYLLTGIEIHYDVYSDAELVPLINLYEISPEWIRDSLEPLIAKWRLQLHKDPDFATSII
jgi:hypothetical protein